MSRPDGRVPSVCTHSSSGGRVRVHCHQQRAPGLSLCTCGMWCVFCTSFHKCVLMPHWPAWHSGGCHADICLLHCIVIASMAVLLQQHIGIFAMQINTQHKVCILVYATYMLVHGFIVRGRLVKCQLAVSLVWLARPSQSLAC